MAVGITQRKHAHLNPTQTVQYYNTTVQIRRQYDDTTTVTAVYYSTSLLLAVGCWLLLDSYLRKANRRPPNTKQVAVAITLPLTSACLRHASLAGLPFGAQDFFLSN